MQIYLSTISPLLTSQHSIYKPEAVNPLTPFHPSLDMLQETLPTSPPAVGPRFRPYASPNHHVTKGRYITSNDPRGYIPVYEYPLNGQWIMMDIDDGYILWTGIWKALGNSKADIVKMIDSQPDLAPLIRRVRGGYLKIQGTWMPYEVALRLSRRVAWPIRDDLVPLFGPTFPSTCLSPDQPGYGQVVATGSNRRRTRRATTQATTNPIGATTETHSGWVVTSEAGPSQPLSAPHPPHHSQSHSSYYQSYRDRESRPHHSYRHPSPTSSYRPPHSHAPSESTSPSLVARERAGSSSVRYSPYVGHSPHPASRRLSPHELSLDIPALSLKDRGPSSAGASNAVIDNKITLPPLKAPAHLSSSLNGSAYALPPISAMEDLRGIHATDSTAVLRRLREDDDSGPSSLDREEESEKLRRRSFSFQPYRSPALHSAVRGQDVPRSYPDSAYRSRTPAYSSDESDNDRLRHSGHRGHSGSLSLSVPSDNSHDGMSTCDPSPISPATPRSATSTGYPAFLSPHHQPATIKSRRASEAFHPLSVPVGEWAGSRRPSDALPPIEPAFPRRHSDADSEMAHPHRPW